MITRNTAVAEVITPTTIGVKYHPGHYLQPTGDRTVNGYLMKQAYSEINNNPALVGLQLHIKWADIENDNGTINYTLVRDHLNKLSANNGKKRLIIFLTQPLTIEVMFQ